MSLIDLCKFIVHFLSIEKSISSSTSAGTECVLPGHRQSDAACSLLTVLCDSNSALLCPPRAESLPHPIKLSTATITTATTTTTTVRCFNHNRPLAAARPPSHDCLPHSHSHRHCECEQERDRELQIDKRCLPTLWTVYKITLFRTYNTYIRCGSVCVC